jgi:hypothetical protein
MPYVTKDRRPPPGDPWWDTNGVFGEMPDSVELLTLEQINSLPQGVRVGVLWEGGNGPHEYVIMRDKHGVVYPESVHSLQMYALNPHMLAHQRLHNDGFGTRIGPRMTRVWLINDRQPFRKPRSD